MENRFHHILEVFEALQKEKVEYILVGGMAVVFHGFARTTEDLDIFIKMHQGNVKKLRKALMTVYNDDTINEITLPELDTYPVIRYGTPEGFYIDILARLGEAVAYDDLDVSVIEIEGVKIRIATPESLYKIKKDTVRPKDKQDAVFLKRLIGKQEPEE